MQTTGKMINSDGKEVKEREDICSRVEARKESSGAQELGGSGAQGLKGSGARGLGGSGARELGGSGAGQQEHGHVLNSGHL